MISALQLMKRHKERGNSDRVLVVVSARGGLTDQLFHLYSLAKARKPFHAELQQVIQDQELYVKQCFIQLGGNGMARAMTQELQQLYADACTLEATLTEVVAARESLEVLLAKVVGWGECWSARLGERLLKNMDASAAWLNARDVLFAEEGNDPRRIDFGRSDRSLSAWLHACPASLVVVTGFLCTTARGCPAILGRNGSDYSASLFARLTRAFQLTIWSDVAGLLSIDPDLKEPGVEWSSISFEAAHQLALLESGVLHSHTLAPLKGQSITIDLKSSFHPETGGTRIVPQGDCAHWDAGLGVVTGVSSVSVFFINSKASNTVLGLPEEGGGVLCVDRREDQLVLVVAPTAVASVSQWLASCCQEALLAHHGCALVAWVHEQNSLTPEADTLWQTSWEQSPWTPRWFIHRPNARMALFPAWDHPQATRWFHRRWRHWRDAKRLNETAHASA
jgi:aspartate kinase